MKSSTRSMILIGLLTILSTVLSTRTTASMIRVMYDEEINAVSGGDVPRNISTLMGFNDLYDDGYNGSGVSIAILDTGINGDHDDLKVGLNMDSSLLVVNESFVPSESHEDLDGHGTFVAGMVIGNGNSSSGTIVGMAPATEIWNVKVLDENGEGAESWLVNAINWILSEEEKPDIVSLSLGATVPLTNVEPRVKQLWDAGIIVVCAAGNEGPEYFTVNSPGTVLETISVGASSTDKFLMAFSSEGPTYPDYYYKPEILAFGLDLVSTHYTGGYAQGSGTSFAVPFITAGIALLHQATSKEHSPDEIKAAIMESATPLGYLDFMEGKGLPNFSRALELLENGSWNGLSILPGEISFPVVFKEGTSAENEPEKWLMKATIINSRNENDLTFSVTGDIADFTSVTVEEYDGGTDQFVLAIQVMKSSSSFATGTGTVLIKANGETIAMIEIEVTSGQPGWISLVVVLMVVALLVGVVVTFALAYKKGSAAVPHARCEIEGICPSG